MATDSGWVAREFHGQTMRSQRARHDWATNIFTFTLFPIIWIVNFITFSLKHFFLFINSSVKTVVFLFALISRDFFVFWHKWQLLHYSCLENSMDRGAWQATVHGVSKSQTWPSAYTFRIYGSKQMPIKKKMYYIL